MLTSFEKSVKLFGKKLGKDSIFRQKKQKYYLKIVILRMTDEEQSREAVRTNNWELYVMLKDARKQINGRKGEEGCSTVKISSK